MCFVFLVAVLLNSEYFNVPVFTIYLKMLEKTFTEIVPEIFLWLAFD